jgi:hypothetical protein
LSFRRFPARAGVAEEKEIFAAAFEISAADVAVELAVGESVIT